MKEEIKKEDAEFIDFKIEKAKKEGEKLANKYTEIKIKEAKISGFIIGLIVGVLLMLFYLFIITNI